MDGAWGGTLPLVLGHEGAGKVVAAGCDSGVAVGSRVIVSLLYACQQCSACHQPKPAMCSAQPPALAHLSDTNGHPVGVGLKTAAFAEQVVVDASQVAVIDNTLPFEQACLLSCGVLTGWGSVTNIAQLPAGKSTAVVGCGGVGVNCLQAAVVAGASPLVAIDVSAEKLKLTAQFGATHGLNATAPDLPAQVRAITNSDGFDYIFMAAGSAKAVRLSLKLLNPLGTLILVGMTASDDLTAIDTADLAEKQVRILGSKMGGSRLADDMPALLTAVQHGQLKLQELIAHRYSLDNINDAITAARRGDALRHVIVF